MTKKVSDQIGERLVEFGLKRIYAETSDGCSSIDAACNRSYEGQHDDESIDHLIANDIILVRLGEKVASAYCL